MRLIALELENFRQYAHAQVAFESGVTAIFREVKELPRGVRIKPPLSERLKVYMGQGTMRIEGKYDSVRAVLRDVRIDFKGVAAFTMQGAGTASIDGVKRELTPVSAFTMLVPEPNWQAEDDVKPQTPKADER